MFKFIILIIFFKSLFCEDFSKNNDEIGKEIAASIIEDAKNLEDRVLEFLKLKKNESSWQTKDSTGSCYYFFSKLRNDDEKKKFIEDIAKSQKNYKNFLKKFIFSNSLSNDQFFFENGKLNQKRADDLLTYILMSNENGEGSFFKELRKTLGAESFPYLTKRALCIEILFSSNDEKARYKKIIDDMSHLMGPEIRLTIHKNLKAIKKWINQKEEILSNKKYIVSECNDKKYNFNDLINRFYLIETIFSFSTLKSNFKLEIKDKESLFLILKLLTGGIYTKNEIDDYVNAFENFLEENSYKYSVFGTNAGDARFEYFVNFKKYLAGKKIKELKVLGSAIEVINYKVNKDSAGKFSDFNGIFEKINQHVEKNLLDDWIKKRSEKNI